MSEQAISNYISYNSGMNKSYLDKIFFLNKVEGIESVLDFGCASGDILKHIHDIDSELKLYGYDNDPNMIDIANDRHSGIAIFGSDFEKLIDFLSPETSLLNLSSVIHEVYSYSNPFEIKEFWKKVYESGFKYISIRDLCVSKTCNRESSPNDYVKLLSKCDSEQLTEYENIWGSTRNNKNLIHYLLKYRYRDNWLREVKENYFPICTEDLLKMIPLDKYEVIYFNHYVLPFTYQKVKQDYGIEIKDNTHIQLLLKRREDYGG